MSRTKELILKDLAEAVVQMNEEKARLVANEALLGRIDAYEAVNEGLIKGMEVVGQHFETGVYFVPEVLVASDAMVAGLEILKPHIKGGKGPGARGVIGVVGVVEGDTHDIGKNIVKLMLETSGFEMIDLGRDVEPRRFIEKALEENARLICLSTLMTTTMPAMKETVDLLVREKVRGRFAVMVGGAPVTPSYARSIGADGYAVNAAEAVRVAKQLLTVEGSASLWR